MMKNYSPKIAAQRIVRSNTCHGLSRYLNPELAKDKIVSILTEKAHTSALTVYAKWLCKQRGKHLKNSIPNDARDYLKAKALICRQSTVCLARQAINFHLHRNDPLSFVPAQVPTERKNRAYSQKQIELLADHASPALRLSILIAVDTGLRDMELISLSNKGALKPSDRLWHQDRFVGREDDSKFVVRGKGGLNREIRLSQEWAVHLPALARPEAVKVRHREADLMSHYDLIAGQSFSIEFGRLSKKVLGFSNGSHGLRHTFAQRRRNELMCCGFAYDQAVNILSQELGHFSIKNTLAYLRD